MLASPPPPPNPHTAVRCCFLPLPAQSQPLTSRPLTPASDTAAILGPASDVWGLIWGAEI